MITVTSFILPRKVEENFTEEIEFRLGASLQRTRSFKCPGLPCRQLPVVWPLGCLADGSGGDSPALLPGQAGLYGAGLSV